jgi:short-subunit dehydrogenase
MKKLLVISGGTKGIGRAIVVIFAQNEFDIITCSRNQDDLDRLSKEIQSTGVSNDVSGFKADLSKRGEVDGFVRFINSFKRPVDVLINNTGTFQPGSISTEAEGVFDQMLETNLHSAYHLTRGLIGDIIKNKRGHIFNICSTASIMPYINGGSYCISKYAMYGMTQVLREEMKEHNVRVTAVLPGATYTSSWEGADLPPERLMKPEDVASAVWNAYEMSSRTVVEEIILRPQLGDLV